MFYFCEGELILHFSAPCFEILNMIQPKLLTTIFLFALALFLTSCDSILTGSRKADTGYQTYSGRMGNKELVLHLTKADSYNGYIWLKETQYPIMVYSNPTIKPAGDSIYLSGGNSNYWITLKGIINETITGEMTLQIGGMQDPAEKVHLSPDDSFSKFLFTYSEASANLPEKLKNESTFKYFIGIVVPLNQDNEGQKLLAHIRELAGIPASDTDISGWMRSEMDSSLAKWKAEADRLTPEEATMMGMSFSKQVHNLLGVMYENEKTITLANYVYDYEGGAHGNYSTTLLNVDKTSGRKLSVEDVLSSEGIKILPDLLDKAARKQYRITNTKPLESNGFFANTILPGENFYITSKGIGFYYSPYEIKPFSDGEINLFIPKEELTDYWIR